jgi:hypothetical protein
MIAMNVYSKPLNYIPYLDINQMYQLYFMTTKQEPNILPLDLNINVENIDPNTITQLEINSSVEQYDKFCDAVKNNNTNDTNYKKHTYRILSEINKYVNEMKRAFNINVNTNISEWVLFDDAYTSDNDDTDYSNNNNVRGFDSYNKKYFNVFLEKSKMSNDSCEWLMLETNKQVKEIYGEWKNDRHVRYPTYDISIDKLKMPVTNYILNFFAKVIGPLVYNRFNISTTNSLDVIDAFIVKYDLEKQTSLAEHTDDSHITAILLLSNESSFSGGGTKFESGLCVYPSQGDILLFGSKYRHQGLEIKSGVRMILTFFIEVVSE